MKLIIYTTFIFFFLGAYAMPETDDEARAKIKAAFSAAEAIITEFTEDLQSKLSDHWLLALKPLVKSIDQECVFQKYKKAELLDELMNEDVLITKIKEMIENPIEDKRLPRLAVVGLTCSSRISPLLTFIFNSLAAFGELAFNFRELPPVDEYYPYIVCYAHYAIGHNIVDPTNHSGFKPPALVNQTLEECYDIIEQNLFMLKAMTQFDGPRDDIEVPHYECIVNEILGFAKKVLFMFNVLFQAEVPETEKALEEKIFVNDFHNAIDKIVLCESSIRKKTSS